MNVGRVTRGGGAALVVAIAGAVALVSIALFFSLGQPFGTINDLALIALVVALVPVMLAHYELGGVVPLWPARLSLAGSATAAVAWSALQLAFVLGLVQFDYDHAATGAFAVSNLLQAVIGLWIAGASLLAGRWIPAAVRALGILAGLGTVLLSVGLLLGGMSHPLTVAGGLGYALVLPVWAFMLGRVFSAWAAEAEPALHGAASVS